MASSAFASSHLAGSLPSSSSAARRRLLLLPRCSAATAAAPQPQQAITLYDVLRVPAGATGGQIKAAYRRLARECHPDVAGAGRKGADEFIRVHAAYATLSDPQKRAEYDHGVLAAAAAMAMAAATSQTRTAAFSSKPRRRWESEQCW